MRVFLLFISCACSLRDYEDYNENDDMSKYEEFDYRENAQYDRYYDSPYSQYTQYRVSAIRLLIQ